MSIRSIITRLGGISAVARELQHKNVTTVQGWWDREVIPARRQMEVLKLAKRLDVSVTPIELIPVSEAE